MKKLISLLVFLSVLSFAQVTDAMLQAIAKVESNENDLAVNISENAVGRYQIRPAYFREIQRICGLRGKPCTFTLADRQNATKAREMAEIYLNYWGEQYRKATGKAPTAEVYFKIHNGHAFWKRSRTANPTYFANIERYAKKASSRMIQ